MKKEKDSERVFITSDEAVSLLDGNDIHTFRNPNGMLIGADWSKKSLIKMLKELPEDQIEIGGEGCRRMGHGLIAWTDGAPLFIQVDDTKIHKLLE